jgi:L-alanine-DL-glutamate epimerase-like enolase superfamily enzyme
MLLARSMESSFVEDKPQSAEEHKMSTFFERRHFLASLPAVATAAAMITAGAAHAAPESTGVSTKLPVTDMQILQLTAQNGSKSLYLKIVAGDGVEGLYGPIDDEAAMCIERFFTGHLIGFDALAIDAFWDKMFRVFRHARGSLYLMALSAIDNTLWDLKARYFGVPVYKLIGGERDTIRAYASWLGFSQETEAMQSRARALKEEGYRHQKWFLRSRGPKQGPQGLDEDVRVVRELREAVGEDVDLMFDAFSTWNIQYALAWAKRVEVYHPRWIEEPFLTSQIDAFVELSQKTSVPVATGEHFYNRWDVHNFLKTGAISVVQADPEWCGGVSEMLKICTLASLHGAQVIPHGHSMRAAMHVVASQPEEICPLAEYLIGKMSGNYMQFEKEAPKPEHGLLKLGNKPGFGIEFDESKIEDMRPVHWKQS